MKVDLNDLLDANGYTIGTQKNIRKKTFREILSEAPREILADAAAKAKSFSAISRAIFQSNVLNAQNQKILVEALDYWGIDYSHIKTVLRPGAGKRPVDENMLPEEVLDTFFTDDPKSKVSWWTLLRMIKKHGLLPENCSECGISPKWNGKSLTLHVDHINGVRTDNRIENLRRLCPNCHSQTDTFGAKNRNTPSFVSLVKSKKV